MSGETLICVVDDDQSVRDSAGALLRSVGYSVAIFDSSEVFLESGTLPKTNCLVLDMRMPGMDGLELQRRLNASDFVVPIIFISAHEDGNSRQLAMEAGAVTFFQKPFVASDLLAAVEAALKLNSGQKRGKGC